MVGAYQFVRFVCYLKLKAMNNKINYENVWGEYFLTTKALGIDFVEAYLAYKDMDHIVLSKYEIMRAYLDFTENANIPLEEALAAWDIHIRMSHFLYDLAP